MQLRGDDGHLKPNLQAYGFLILGVLSVVMGLQNLLYLKYPLDRISWPFELLGGLGFFYASWYGFKKLRKSKTTR